MRYAWVAVAALVVAPGVVSAQADPPRRGMGPMGGMMQQNVARLLLERGADLELQAKQVTKLEAIAKKLDARAEPVLKEMREVREAGGMRDLPAERRQALMAKVQELRTAGDEAFEKEIRPLLDATQAGKAAKIIEEARPPRGGPRR